MKQIIEGAWLLPLPALGSNTVLLRGDDGELALIDSGLTGHSATLFKALASIGHRPEDLSHLVFTHAHPDHLGSGHDIVARTGAKTWIHTLDARSRAVAARSGR